jgi:hypothetical protein
MTTKATRFCVGDLIQYNPSPKQAVYYTKLNGKIGIIKELWNSQGIARIEWADTETISQWIAQHDMKVLNREHK